MTRPCLTCKQELPIEQFHKKPNGLMGCRATCKPCTSELRKVKYHANPENYKISGRKSYRKNKTKSLAKSKEWVAQRPHYHRDCAREKRLKYLQNNPPLPVVFVEITKKICSRCNIEKPLLAFGLEKKGIAGRRSDCKLCRISYKKEYRLQNRDKLLAVETAYRAKNPEKIKMAIDKWRSVNKDYQKKRRAVDPAFKLSCVLRKRMNDVVKGRIKTSSVINLGMLVDQVISYLINKYNTEFALSDFERGRIDKPQMEVSDFCDLVGRFKFHIDHIKPVSWFNLFNELELKQVCHFSNLRLLWWQDNLRKSNKTISHKSGNLLDRSI